MYSFVRPLHSNKSVTSSTQPWGDAHRPVPYIQAFKTQPPWYNIESQQKQNACRITKYNLPLNRNVNNKI